MLSGECFCGEISYELEGTLQNARSCHCSRCRKAFSGSSSAYAELFPGSKITWTGIRSLSTYTSKSGWSLGFCNNCGSTLCGLWKGKVHGLTLGCINGDPGIEIEAHLFVGSKAPWDCIGGDAPQYDEFPVPKKEYPRNA